MHALQQQEGARHALLCRVIAAAAGTDVPIAEGAEGRWRARPRRIGIAMPLKVTVKHWHAAASWTWNAGDDVCGICRMPFDGCPPGSKFPGDDSPVVWGTCGHAYHLQCISKWLQSDTDQRCPICRAPWGFKIAGEGGGDENAPAGGIPPLPDSPPPMEADSDD